MDIQKNDHYEIEITGVTSEGNGVGHIGDYAVFVPDTARGERCLIKLVQNRSSYGFGKLLQVIEPSPNRIDADCDAYPQCGGCTYRHITYSEECAIKEQMVRDVFSRIGRIKTPVQPIVSSKRQIAYRNKAQYPFGVDREGKTICGFYARRSHRIVTCSNCALHPPLFEQIRRTVCDLVERNHIPVYDERSHSGILRHLYLRIGEKTGEVMVCFVSAKKQPKRFIPLAEALAKTFHQIKSIVLNVNEEKTNVILGKECFVLYGKETIVDVLGGLKFHLSPLSFYQVNRDQAEILYETALACASLTPNDTLLDLYCGAGTIGLCAAAHVKRVIGVEIVSDAIKNAERNAKENGIKNASFFCADASAAASRFAAEGVRPDVVLVDPPRKGLDEKVIQAIGRMAPERVVMVSCNPATAARDASFLQREGYAVQKIVPIDMFPRTAHVETVVLLSKLNTKQHVEVELNLDELDLTAAESKATYDEIKAYVLEKHGLKVSSLYISQVKRKCGLDVGQNYNLSKKENAKVPQCPPEKEAAIMEALKHFQMI